MKNFLKENKLNILILLIAILIGMFVGLFSPNGEPNDETIQTTFRWGRTFKIIFLIGGWNLINHYFLKNKNKN